MLKNDRAFTSVEIIVVVTVIAVLAAITAVTYGNVQKKSRDSLRTNDVSTLSKAISIYATQNGSWTPTGCGDTSNTLTGDINRVYSANSIMTCLKNYDSTTKQISDPSGCVSSTDSAASCKTAMRGYYGAYNCGTTYYVLARLEITPTTGTIAASDMCAAGKTFATNGAYNYVQKVR